MKPVLSKTQVFGLLILAIVLAGCDSSVTITADISPGEKADFENEIMALESEWSDKFVAGDIEGIMSMMADDSVLIMPGVEPAVGIDAIRTATADMLAADDSEASWKSIRAFVSDSGDMAWDYGVATTRFDDGSVAEGYYLVVWVREDGEWKIAADMFN